MHLEVTQVQNGGFVEVATCHKGKKILWPAMTYSKVRLREPLMVFDEINDFLKWLPEESQDGIFQCYVEIKDLLDMAGDAVVAKALKQRVKELYQFAPMEKFRHWTAFELNLMIPDDIYSTMSENSRYDETENTYLRPAYINAAVMALAIRLMVPIWGEFIDQSVGNDFKETEAVGLLDETEIKSWPEEEPAWEKLYRYIRHFGDTESSAILLSNLWRGQGSEEIPDCMMARVVVRRLTLAPLRGPHSHNIIANIYRYVDNNSSPQERSAKDRVIKKDPDKGQGDEDKISIVESYKLKQRVSDGDVVLFEVATRNIAGMCQYIDPTIDMEKVKICSDAALLNDIAILGEIHLHQTRLAQWIMRPVFPPKAFSLIDHMSVIRLLAASQALLWHWGFLDLALLMQVKLVTESDQMIPSLTRSVKSGARILPQYKEELNKLFPYHKPQRVKANDINPENAFINPVVTAINNATQAIRSSDWLYRGPDALYLEAKAPENLRRMVPVPQTIKNTITELVIHLAKLNT